MRNTKNQAVVLRKSGLSYSEIIKRLKVPRSTLSLWFHGKEWSDKVTRENNDKAIINAGVRMGVLNVIKSGRLKSAFEEAKREAIEEFESLKYDRLFLTAVSLYWCHGNKSSRSAVTFSSANWKKIMVFKLFLENICSIKGYRLQLILKKGQEYGVHRDYWAGKCGFDKDKFYLQRKNAGAIEKIKHSKNNKSLFSPCICNIVVTSAYFKSKISKWLELIENEFVEKRV